MCRAQLNDLIIIFWTIRLHLIKKSIKYKILDLVNLYKFNIKFDNM